MKKPFAIFPIHIPSSGIITHPSQNMAARFAPLALPAQLHDLPQNYAQRIKSFGNEGHITTQHHVDRFMDFIDLEEVDHEDAIMRLFSHSFTGEVKKWFRAFTTGRIHDFQQFQDVFLRKWETKKNSLQLLTQYNNLKRIPMESMQKFSTIFIRSYDSIPAHVKPPPGSTQLYYADTFDSDFTLTLRERRSASLVDMMNDTIEVEVNLMDSSKMQQKIDSERKKVKDEAQSSSSHSLDARFDNMMKIMENIMERLVVGDRPAITQKQDHHIRKPNFRRHQFP